MMKINQPIKPGINFRVAVAMVILLLVSTTFVGAQTRTITGQISAADTKETLPGVHVLSSEKTGTVSDLEGKYLLNVPQGRSKLVFKFIGFSNVTKYVDIKSTETVVLDIEITEQSQA